MSYRSRPQPRQRPAHSGMTCIRPRAPTKLVAFGLPPLSMSTMETTKAGSRPLAVGVLHERPRDLARRRSLTPRRRSTASTGATCSWYVRDVVDGLGRPRCASAPCGGSAARGARAARALPPARGPCGLRGLRAARWSRCRGRSRRSAGTARPGQRTHIVAAAAPCLRTDPYEVRVPGRKRLKSFITCRPGWPRSGDNIGRARAATLGGKSLPAG
jgi:hypothetical protein